MASIQSIAALESLIIHTPASCLPIRSLGRSRVIENVTARQIIHFFTSKRSSGGVTKGHIIENLKLFVATEALRTLKMHNPASFFLLAHRSPERSRVIVNATGQRLIYFPDSFEGHLGSFKVKMVNWGQL